MWIVLIVVLLLLAVGGLPSMPYWGAGPHAWGYYPSGILGLLLVVLVVLLLLGRLT